jgi:hypothetical protein
MTRFAAIIGAEKTATTMLAAALDEHPEADVLPTEFCAFADPLYRKSTTAADLAARFSGPPALRRVFKCAAYFGKPEVPQRLATDLERPRLILAVRDPVRRAVSAWYWYVRLGYLPPVSASDGLASLLSGRFSHSGWHRLHRPTGWDPRALGTEWVLEWGLYAHQLDTWLRAFSIDDVHIVTDTDLRNDAAAAVRAMYRALELDDDVQPTAHLHRYNEGIYPLWRLRFLRTRLRWHWRRNDNGIWISTRPEHGLPAYANALVAGVDRLVFSRIGDNDPPPLDPAVENDLRRYYASDVVRLRDEFGLDVNAWLAPERAAA